MAEISIRDVVKSYGRETVIPGLSLDIGAAEFLVILGPSGCGKSTLLRMIAGLESVTDGTIAIDGRIVNELEPRDRGCAMVFQNYALYPHMSVADNIGYALRVAKVPKAERRARVMRIAELIGLHDLLDRKPGQLSGGQRQRVAMGRAMIREPRVFLFDEPLSNLDAKLRVQMRSEIRQLHNRLGTTSVFVTHDQIEAMTLADRLVLMNGGRIEQVGSPSEIYARPASAFVASFIGSPPMNLMNARLDRAARALHLPGDLQIPFGRSRIDAIAADTVQIGIRPEAFHVARAATDMGLKARFSFAEELGSVRLWHLDIAGHPLIMQTTATRPPGVNAIVTLGFDFADMHLFDVESGLRIDPELDTQPSAAGLQLQPSI